MVQGGSEYIPFLGYGAVNQQEIRLFRHHADVELAHAARTANPAELRIKDQKRDHAGPENRHGVARKAEHADQVVWPAIFVDRRHNAQRNTQSCAENDRESRKLDGRRKDVQDVVYNWLARTDRGAEIEGGDVFEIDKELFPHGAVQSELPIHSFIDLARGVFAHDGAHRIGRHDTSDDKGQYQQAEQGHRDRSDLTGNAPETTAK